jgi:hypothetical protein
LFGLEELLLLGKAAELPIPLAEGLQIRHSQLEIAGAPHCTRRVSAGRNAEVMIEP